MLRNYVEFMWYHLGVVFFGTGSESFTSWWFDYGVVDWCPSYTGLYLHNPMSPTDRQRAEAASAVVPAYFGDPYPRLRDFILDTVKWKHWNSQLIFKNYGKALPDLSCVAQEKLNSRRAWCRGWRADALLKICGGPDKHWLVNLRPCEK